MFESKSAKSVKVPWFNCLLNRQDWTIWSKILTFISQSIYNLLKLIIDWSGIQATKFIKILFRTSMTFKQSCLSKFETKTMVVLSSHVCQNDLSNIQAAISAKICSNSSSISKQPVLLKFEIR